MSDHTTSAVNSSWNPRNATWAYFISGLTLAAALVIAASADLGDGFVPRVATIDALAGLTVAAFLVDRLLTFIPPPFPRHDPKKRTFDLNLMRFGFGALVAAAFVSLTDLRAVQALTSTEGVDDAVDRMITVLALAGGAKGLTSLTSALNPPKDTDGTAPRGKETPDNDTQSPPTWRAYGLGATLLAAGALAAYLFARDDTAGLELLHQDLQEGGTTAAVVRFGVVILAAGIIQQLIEIFAGRENPKPSPNRPLLTGGAAVVLGVGAALILHLFLLHNLGFFGGTTDQETVSDALARSSDLQRWGDVFVTGIVIAAGTKPLHDLSTRLKAAKANK